MDEDYEFTARRLGTPVARSQFGAEELSYIQDRLPPHLIEFLSEMGHCVFDNAVTLCPPKQFAPILALVFKADADLDHRDCTLVSYSGFGELGIWSGRHGPVFANLVEGRVMSRALAGVTFNHNIKLPKPAGKPNDPNRMANGTVFCEADEVDFYDWQGNNMLADAVRIHGPLALGECYGFFPALGIAGTESRARSVKNLKRVQAFEHFTMLAQLQPFYLSSIASGRMENVREIG